MTWSAPSFTTREVPLSEGSAFGLSGLLSGLKTLRGPLKASGIIPNQIRAFLRTLTHREKGCPCCDARNSFAVGTAPCLWPCPPEGSRRLLAELPDILQLSPNPHPKPKTSLLKLLPSSRSLRLRLRDSVLPAGLLSLPARTTCVAGPILLGTSSWRSGPPQKHPQKPTQKPT
jgi:hypothetical protein